MLKKAAIYFVSCAFCISLGSLSAKPALAELRVMAINTEWLWSPHDGQVDGGKFNRGDMTPKSYSAELRFYTGLIRKHAIDIVALSEIENVSVAEDLARQLGTSWRAYFKQGRDTATGQDVAILSRLKPIKGSTTDFGFPSGFIPGDKKAKRLSKVVGARFYHPDTQQTIGVVTSHFLSKRNDSPKKARNRLKQAYALSKAVKELRMHNDVLIVLGDFNDYRGSPVISSLMREGELQNAEVGCRNSQNGLFSKSVDHVLFVGLSCQKYGRLNLGRFSDHDAVFAVF